MRHFLFLLFPIFALSQGATNDYIFSQKPASGPLVVRPVTPTVGHLLGWPTSINSPAAITLGTGLSLAGSTLNATASSAWADLTGVPANLTSWAGITRASGVDTFVTTPSSANLVATVTDETGSGSLVFAALPTFVTRISTPEVRGSAGGGGGLILSNSSASTAIQITAGATANINIPSSTASTIAHFNNQRNLVSLPLDTYPSLTELSYVKGVTSAIQTQLNATTNASNLTSGTLALARIEQAGATSGQAIAWNGTAWAPTTIASGTNTGDQTITLTGDVTGSGTGSFAATIANDAVTFAKMQEISGTHLVGRHGSGSGNIQEVSVGEGVEFQGSGIRRSALTGDVTAPAGNNTTTLATVNSNVGSFGSATAAPAVTVNAKGLVTAVTTNTITPAVGSITGLGTGVSTFLGTPTLANLNTAVSDADLATTGANTFTGGLTISSTTSLLLGTAGSAVGNIGFRNATSGTATLEPPTGALGTYTVTLPGVASTLATLGANTFTGTQTLSAITGGTGSAVTITGNDASGGVLIFKNPNAFTGTTSNLSLSGGGTMTFGGCFQVLTGTSIGGVCESGNSNNFVRLRATGTEQSIYASSNTLTMGISTATNGATATAHTLKGPNATGTTSTGGSLTIAGGTGTSAGGAVIISTAATTTQAAAVTVNKDGVTTFAKPLVLPVYTVATLPATAAAGMVQGAHAVVTDATDPTYLGALTGGGAVVCPVFYTGTAWVSH